MRTPLEFVLPVDGNSEVLEGLILPVRGSVRELSRMKQDRAKLGAIGVLRPESVERPCARFSDHRAR